MNLFSILLLAVFFIIIAWGIKKAQKPKRPGKEKERSKLKDSHQTQEPVVADSDELCQPATEDSYWNFLSYFRDVQEIGKDKYISSWSATLGRPYNKVMDEFISKGLLKKAGVKEKLAGLLRAEDLKRLLREHGLKLSGKKDELLCRYIEARPKEAEERASTMGEAFICTPEGVQKVTQHAKKMADRRDSEEQAVQHLLAKGKIDQAAELVTNIRQSYRYAPRDDSWVRKHVKMVMDIKEVAGLTPVEIKEAQISWATERLWTGDSRGMFYSPIPSFYKFSRFVAVIIGKEESRAELRGYSEDEFITRVEIMCNDDSCRRCKAVGGRKYPLKSAPLLPIDGCTHEDGCRCCYTPVVD